MLLVSKTPRLRHNQHVQLPILLVELRCKAAAHARHTLVRPDEHKPPIRRHDVHHVEELRQEMSERSALNYKGKPRGVELRFRIVFWMPGAADRSYILGGIVYVGKDRVSDALTVNGQILCDNPAALRISIIPGLSRRSGYSR